MNAGKLATMNATVDRYREMVKWFCDFLFDHPLDLDAKAVLSQVEKATLAVNNRQAFDGWDFMAVFGDVPMNIRRAAINAATGAVKSHLSLVKAWEDAPVTKRGRCPSDCLGTTRYCTPGWRRQRLKCIREGFIRVKLLNPDSQRWEWVKIPVIRRSSTLGLLESSQIEKERQQEARIKATEATRLEGRVDEKGHLRFTKDERAQMRLVPGAVQALSPTLVVNRRGASFNISFRTAVTVVRAEPGRLSGLHKRVVTVEINTFNVAVVSWDGEKVLKVPKMSYGSMQSNRERQVGKAI